MTFTLLKAQGKAVARPAEDDFIQTAKYFMKLAEEKGELIFPNEILVADAFDANANTQVVSYLSPTPMGLYNGPAATKMIQEKLADCKTVIWNGPMGVFEMDAFAKGTFAICDTLKELTEGRHHDHRRRRLRRAVEKAACLRHVAVYGRWRVVGFEGGPLMPGRFDGSLNDFPVA